MTNFQVMMPDDEVSDMMVMWQDNGMLCLKVNWCYANTPGQFEELDKA